MTPTLPGDVSRLELYTVLQALADGVTIANREGRIVFSNDAANRILGTTATDEAPERWADHYGVFLPNSDVPFPAEAYPLVLALAGEESLEVEMLIRNPALPHEVTISASARPLLDAEGSITGAVVVFRDITALRRAQRALERANSKLQETQRLKDELNAFIVHDLKNPLSTVMLLSDLVLGTDGLDERSVRDDLADIRDAAARMHRMVLDLLDVQLADDGRLEPQLERVSLAELVDDVQTSMRARARGIVIRDIDPALSVLGDRSLLFRVCANLVDNCVKYGPQDGRISVEVEAVSATRVRIRIQDEGPGVPHDLREKIFEKYSQVERGRDQRYSDSRGLGLRFCRVAVEAHDGLIWVEDGEPNGARFCVELPLDT